MAQLSTYNIGLAPITVQAHSLAEAKSLVIDRIIDQPRMMEQFMYNKLYRYKVCASKGSIWLMAPNLEQARILANELGFEQAPVHMA